MPKLSKWIRKKFRSAHDAISDVKSSQLELPLGLPVLPRKRPRILTPSSSSENVFQAATAKSAFFQRLPPELRRHIYIAAFGGSTVLIDLEFKYPNVSGLEHARLDPGFLCVRDRTAKPDWRWWSSVCHRTPLYENWRHGCQTVYNQVTHCFLFPWAMPNKCFLGVMGWLLTCRQSYVEGLDVLYSTNRVHMRSVVLMRHLPLLLLPQSLASIMSLELAWNLVLFKPNLKPQTEQERGWPAYQALVSVVALAFPRLKRLSVTIDMDFSIGNPSDKTFESRQQKLLAPIDELVRKLGAHLRECHIAFSDNVYMELEYKAKSCGARAEGGGTGLWSWQRFWRPVAVEQGQQSESGLGYWVRRKSRNAVLRSSILL